MSGLPRCSVTSPWGEDGDVAEAEQVLERARSLGLETDSMNLLNGEIAFAKRDYDAAIDFF